MKPLRLYKTTSAIKIEVKLMDKIIHISTMPIVEREMTAGGLKTWSINTYDNQRFVLPV